jgi:hypothetical protein
MGGRYAAAHRIEAEAVVCADPRETPARDEQRQLESRLLLLDEGSSLGASVGRRSWVVLERR